MFDIITINGTKVLMKIDTKLPLEKRVALFSFDCDSGNELYAALLANHLENLFREFREDIARHCWLYLGNAEEISKLKSKLNREWNSKDHCWK